MSVGFAIRITARIDWFKPMIQLARFVAHLRLMPANPSSTMRNVPAYEQSNGFPVDALTSMMVFDMLLMRFRCFFACADTFFRQMGRLIQLRLIGRERLYEHGI